MAGANGGGADDLCFVQNAGGHFVLKPANLALVVVDVSVHQTLLFAPKGGEGFPQFTLFVLQKRKFFLLRMVFQHRIEGCRAKGFSNLDRAANTEGLDAQIQEPFKQVVHRYVGFGGGQDGAASLLGQHLEQMGGRGRFPCTGWTLNQRHPTFNGRTNSVSLRLVQRVKRRRWSPVGAASTDVGREGGALVDVQHVAEDQLVEHGPTVAFR